MDRRLLTTALLIATLALGATAAQASDPHAKKPAAEAHAPKPAEHAPKTDGPAPKADAHAPKADGPAPKTDAHAPKADGHAPKAAEAPAAKPSPAASGKPTATDLHALKARIQERVAEVRKAQQAAAKTRTPERVERALHGVSGQSADTTAERVRVVWRISVDWPDELQQRERVTTDGSEQVQVSWGMAGSPAP